jgi:hypothetical protein
MLTEDKMAFKSDRQRKAVMAKLKSSLLVDVQWRGFQKASKVVRADASSKFPVKRDALGRVVLYERDKKGFVKMTGRFPSPDTRPHFIKEPFGLPRELQPTGKFRRLK